MTPRRALILLLVAAFSACARVGSTPGASTPSPDQIEFTIAVGESSSGDITIALGILNDSSMTLPADRYRPSWTLSTSDGEPRASGEGLLPEIEPTRGEPHNVIIWEGPLDPGSYILQWGVPELGSTVARFELVSGDDGLHLESFSKD